MEKPHCLNALRYAEGVVAGEIPNGKWMIAACQRFLDDLKRDDLEFREDKAERVCRFIEVLHHVKGKWMRKHEKIVLEPVQSFIICNIFGFYDEDGDRRFNEVYIEMPRKNAKSTLAAGIGLYCLLEDDEPAAEVYSGATTEKQAWEVFGPAWKMIKGNEKLRKRYGIRINAKSLVVESDYSKFEPMIGKPGDGSSPSVAIIDEVHEHPDSHMIDAMQTGMGSRDNPLLFQITTAGISNWDGPCYQRHQELKHVLEGTVEEDRTFCCIFAADDDDDWDSEEALVKSNPLWGISKNIKLTLAERDKARTSARKQVAYKTKHLDLWCGARQAWLNMLMWHRQARDLNLADFNGCECHIGLDLASKKDVAAAEILFKRGDKYTVFSHFWIPESAVEENPMYLGWAEQGHVTSTPGNMIDYAFIEEEITEWARRFDVLSLAFDPFQAAYLITRLQNNNINCVEYPNTVKNMSDPMKILEAYVLDGRLTHDNNPAMNWMVGNCEVRIDAKDNIFPRKPNETSKIDGLVALIFANGRWCREETDDNYATGRLITL